MHHEPSFLEGFLWVAIQCLVFFAIVDAAFSLIIRGKVGGFALTRWAVRMAVMAAGFTLQGGGWCLEQTGVRGMPAIRDLGLGGWHRLWTWPVISLLFLGMWLGIGGHSLGEALVTHARRRRAAHGRNNGHPHPP